MQQTVASEPDPFLQLRSAAITQLAVFEVVNTIIRDYEPYLDNLTAPPGASPPTPPDICNFRFDIEINRIALIFFNDKSKITNGK